MLILRDYHHCPAKAQGAVVALGNFDGVHRGHQALLQEVKKQAADYSCPAAVMTFDPHPLTVLRNITNHAIMQFGQKARMLEHYGMDVLYAVPFDQGFSQLTAEAFIADILVEQLRVRHVVVGYDFIFGHQRGGNAALLAEKGKEYGYGVTQLAPVEDGGEAYSSSRIRAHITQGEIAEAEALLGHPYILEGSVQRGKQRGRDLGFPTANIALTGYLYPRFGVYAAEVRLPGEEGWHPAAVNIGINPTFNDVEPLLEAYIVDFEGDLYGKMLQVRLHHYLREELTFTTLEALQQQMQEDVKQVGSLLGL